MKIYQTSFSRVISALSNLSLEKRRRRGRKGKERRREREKKSGEKELKAEEARRAKGWGGKRGGTKSERISTAIDRRIDIDRIGVEKSRFAQRERM